MNHAEQSKYELVREVLADLDLQVTSQDKAEGVLVVDDEERGLSNLVLDVDDPILILEMPILGVAPAGLSAALAATLLKWNRELVHGAFAFDASNALVVWRDTLAVENLDANEIESSINALEIAMAEHARDLLDLKQ